MRKWTLWAGWGALLLVLVGASPGLAPAADLDGSAPILCAVMGVMECDRWGQCEPVERQSAGLPPFVRIDVGQRVLQATDGTGRRSEIHASTQAAERLILHGEERGRSWNLVIGQRSGEMTAAIVDSDGAFVVSGTCTLP